MPEILNAAAKRDLLQRGFTRRHLGRMASVLTAGAALPFYNEFALAQRSMPRVMSADAVRISSNENPLGPCPEAVEAIASIAKFGGRYSPHGEQAEFVKTVAEVEGLKPEYIS